MGGASIRDIASERGLKPTTTYSHLAKAYEEGHELEIEDLIPGQAIDWIDEALREVPEAEGRKAVLAYIAEHYQDGLVKYHHLDLVAAYRQRHPLPTAS